MREAQSGRKRVWRGTELKEGESTAKEPLIGSKNGSVIQKGGRRVKL